MRAPRWVGHNLWKKDGVSCAVFIRIYSNILEARLKPAWKLPFSPTAPCSTAVQLAAFGAWAGELCKKSRPRFSTQGTPAVGRKGCACDFSHKGLAAALCFPLHSAKAADASPARKHRGTQAPVRADASARRQPLKGCRFAGRAAGGTAAMQAGLGRALWNTLLRGKPWPSSKR